MSTNPLLSHPDRLLSRHLGEVDRIAERILERHLPGAFASVGLDVFATLRALSGWHDVAKATAFFQSYIADPDGFEQRARSGDQSATSDMKAHTPLGAVLAMRRWADDASPCLVPGSTALSPRLFGLLMTLAVRGHHTSLPSQKKIKDTITFPTLPEQLQNLNPAVELCHPSLGGCIVDTAEMDFESLKDDVQDRIDDALEILDRLPLEKCISFRLAVQFCFSCLLEADKAMLINDTESDYLGLPGRSIEPTVVEDHPPTGQTASILDQQRRECLEAVIQNAQTADIADFRPHILTLPTGLGKTRCAAAWAFHLRDRIERETGKRLKIFVILPFLSIIEQTARVYRHELLGMETARNDETLAVSHSLSVRDYGDLEENTQDRAEFALDTWRSDIILTTFDQFLLALMDPRTKNQQRFHNLCDAIIVLDEIQAFPCRLWDPVGRILRGLSSAGRSHLLLMTATQPGIVGPEHSVPVIQDPGRYNQSRYRLVFDPQERCLTDWLPEFAEEICRPENAGVKKWLLVLNTRQAAQDAFSFLRSELPSSQLFLLSSDIVPLHRLERINEIREASECVVISTQCVEAGVDLDMHRVIRDFGPLDSIIQVAGRCNRHGLRPRADVRVICLTDGRERYCDYIYDHTLLDETEASFSTRPGATVNEEEVKEIVEDYFARLRLHKETGVDTTCHWARFRHDDLNVSQLLRGDQEQQVSFVVGKLDPTLQSEVEAAFRLRDRWDRRRKLRRLASRLALVTVSARKSKHYTPSDIADPLPEGSDDPSFWFLHDDAYDEETGLCPPKTAASMIF